MIGRERLPAILSLAVPVISGIAWMALAGAPANFLLVNSAALALALAWIALGRAPTSAFMPHAFALILLALLFLPLAAGPVQTASSGGEIKRWIPLGPVTIHAGMLAIPALAVCAARDRIYAAPLLSAAALATLLQPDGASGFAVTFAAVGLHHVTRDWRIGLVAIVAFLAAILATLNGELPPATFVERVFLDAASRSVPAAIALALALTGGFFAMLHLSPLERSARYALAGSLFGFTIASLMNLYPTPLVGYGAAPILGFGLALGLRAAQKAVGKSSSPA